MIIVFIKPQVELLRVLPEEEVLRWLEVVGRTCYKSEGRTTPDSAKELLRKIIKNKHLGILEHYVQSARIICDRGISHQSVRHRIASFAQESTRYVDYSDRITFIIPPWIGPEPIEGEYPANELFRRFDKETATHSWIRSVGYMAKRYREFVVNHGWKPEQARGVLPTCLKTEYIVTANIREWRHILTMRTHAAAHPQMREVALELLSKFKIIMPTLFEDI